MSEPAHKARKDRCGDTALEEIAGADKPLTKLVLLRNATRRISTAIVQSLELTHAVILGNPETGRPIPAEQIRAVA